MVKNHFQAGFTLVELMIVVGLLALLMMVGSSLTSSWVAGAQVNSAASSLKSAVYQARIAALRNTGNKNIDQPAASVCIDGDNVKVIAIANNTTTEVCESVYNRPIQKMPYADGIVFKQNGAAISCMTFNPAGLVLSFPGCSNNLAHKIEIEKSGEKVEVDVI